MVKVVFQISWGKRGYPVKSGVLSGCPERNKAGSLLNTVSVRVHCGNRNFSRYFKQQGISHRKLGPQKSWKKAVGTETQVTTLSDLRWFHHL